MNKLFFGDNLDILRNDIKTESIDLVYLDPPFNSGKNYNILFKPEKETIKGATAQIQTFQDTWVWSEQAEKEYAGIIDGSINHERPSQAIINLIQSFRSYLGECSVMAYLVMMTTRLIELHRVLKETGSIYLHCDPTASHYLKLIMDGVFGIKSFRNEIVWKRTQSKGNAFTRFASNHDIILSYTKSDKWTWNQQYKPNDEEYINKFYTHTDEVTGRKFQLTDLTNPNKNRPNLTYEFLGITRVWRWTKERMQKAFDDGLVIQTKPGTVPRFKRYLDEQEGICIDDIWTDISPIQSQSAERLGYPTQKPEALLERIIKASSNEGDLVLDPFCGCGTTVAVAQRLRRNWVGIDITYLSIDIIKKRFENSGIKEKVDFIIEGDPKDVYSAERLASLDPFQFQFWAISKIPGAMPNSTKTGDKGIDGFINFVDPEKKNKAGKGIISVKGTQNRDPGMIRDLKGTVGREKADIGLLLLLKEPTQGMKAEALSAGYYQFMGTNIPKIQILSAEDLFKDPLPIKLPNSVYGAFRTPRINDQVKDLF